MPYCYVDDRFPWHPKTARAGGDAGWLWVCGYAWVQQYLTGGRIPKSVVPTLSDRRSPMRLAARLVEVGLWEDDGADFVMHDYVERNPTAEKARTYREGKKDRSAAGRAGAAARWGKPETASESHATGDAIASEIASESHSPNDANRIESHSAEHAVSCDSAPAPTCASALPIPQSHSYPSRGNHQVVAPDENPEKEIDQEKPQVKSTGDPLADRWFPLFPRRQKEAGHVLTRCRQWFDDAFVDEGIGHVIAMEPRPRSPRYLLTLLADWSQQRGVYPGGHQVYAQLTGKAAD